MPNYPNVDTLSQLIQKQAYYANGGKDEGQYALDKVNTGLGMVDKTVNDVLAIKKANLDRQKVKTDINEKLQGQTPFRDVVMPLTPENSSRQAPPQSMLEPGQAGPQTQEAVNYQNQVENQDNLYRQRAAMGNTTLDQEKELAGINALNSKGNEKYLYANPHDFTDVSVSPDADHTYPIPQKQGLTLGTKNPDVNVITTEQGLNNKTKKKNDVMVNPSQQPTTLSPTAQNYWSDYVAQTGGLPANMGFGMPQLRKNLLEQGADKAAATGQGAAETMQRFKGQTAAISGASGNAKVQDAKVNQATDLQNLLVQNYDPKTKEFIIPPAQHAEIALGVARLLSPTGQVALQLEEQLKQGTYRESLANLLIKAGADPKEVGGTTQSVTKYLAHTIARQGAVARDLRDQYTGGRVGNNFDENVLNNILAPVSTPKVGEIRKGDSGNFAFRGGDPKDKNSWVKVGQ